MQEKLKSWSNNAYVFCRSALAESFKLSLIVITTRKKQLLNKLNVYRLQYIKCIVLSWASVEVFFTFQLVLVTKLWNLIKQFSVSSLGTKLVTFLWGRNDSDELSGWQMFFLKWGATSCCQGNIEVFTIIDFRYCRPSKCKHY